MNSLIPESEDIRLERARQECRDLHCAKRLENSHFVRAIAALRKFDLPPTSQRAAHVLAVRWNETFDKRFGAALAGLAASGQGLGFDLDSVVPSLFYDTIRHLVSPFVEQEHAELRAAIELERLAVEASRKEAEAARDKAAQILTENESLIARLFSRFDLAVELFQTFARQGADGALALGGLVGYVSATESQFAKSQEDNRHRFVAALRKLADRCAAFRCEAEKHRLVARERERLVAQLQQKCRNLTRTLNDARSLIAELQGAEGRARDELAAKESELERARFGSLRRDRRLAASRSALGVAETEADQLRARVSSLEARIAASEAERAALMRQLEQLQLAGRAPRQRRPKD